MVGLSDSTRTDRFNRWDSSPLKVSHTALSSRMLMWRAFSLWDQKSCRRTHGIPRKKQQPWGQVSMVTVSSGTGGCNMRPLSKLGQCIHHWGSLTKARLTITGAWTRCRANLSLTCHWIGLMYNLANRTTMRQDDMRPSRHKNFGAGLYWPTLRKVRTQSIRASALLEGRNTMPKSVRRLPPIKTRSSEGQGSDLDRFMMNPARGADERTQGRAWNWYTAT